MKELFLSHCEHIFTFTSCAVSKEDQQAPRLRSPRRDSLNMRLLITAGVFLGDLALYRHRLCWSLKTS